MVSSVCVYCASSDRVDHLYLNTAFKLGELFVKNNIHCIYGGGTRGLMGSLADGVLSHNGAITGIIPDFMCEREWNHTGLTELIIVGSMHERKELMLRNADAAVALPGGIGTFEELIEAITWRKLGLFTKPVYIVNTNHYFDPLINMLNAAIYENFMDETDQNLWRVVNNPEELISDITK